MDFLRFLTEHRKLSLIIHGFLSKILKIQEIQVHWRAER